MLVQSFIRLAPGADATLVGANVCADRMAAVKARLDAAYKRRVDDIDIVTAVLTIPPAIAPALPLLALQHC